MIWTASAGSLAAEQSSTCAFGLLTSAAVAAAAHMMMAGVDMLAAERQMRAEEGGKGLAHVVSGSGPAVDVNCGNSASEGGCFVHVDAAPYLAQVQQVWAAEAVDDDD